MHQTMNPRICNSEGAYQGPRSILGSRTPISVDSDSLTHSNWLLLMRNVVVTSLETFVVDGGSYHFSFVIL